MEQQLQKLTQAILVRGELLKQLEVQCAAIQASVEEMKPKPVTPPAQAPSSTPPAQASSSRSLATGELEALMPTGCSMNCPNDDTDSRTSAFMPDAAPCPPSTAALLDIAIPDPNVVDAKVLDSGLDSEAWLKSSARPMRVRQKQALSQSVGKPMQEIEMANVYVGRVPSTVTADRLVELFCPFGQIVHARMFKFHGYGMVRYDSPSVAAAAIDYMDGYHIGGSILGVRVARLPAESDAATNAPTLQMTGNEQGQIDMTNLYVCHPPYYVTTEKLMEIFLPCGQITQAKVVDRYTGVGKGFGFVKFADPYSAAVAITHMNGYPLEGHMLDGYIQRLDISPPDRGKHRTGHIELTRSVAGADVNRKLFLGYATTVAAHALVTASSRGFDDAVVILLQNGVDVDCMARVLLQSVKPALHANVDCTSLVAAITSQHISTVEHLIKEGSYLDCLVQVGSWSGDPASGEELRVGACLGEHYNTTCCAVEYYESSGEILKLLLDKAPWWLENPNKGRNLLCDAILCQNPNAVSLLLQTGANPRFAIMTKGRHVSHPIHLAARLGYAPVLKQLMADGAEINAQTSTWDTPLMVSAWTGYPDCFLELIKFGVDLGIVSNADHVSWWELTLLASHVHPSVSTMARTLLSGNNIVYSGDPLTDLSLPAFLDKFMEKKQKGNRIAEGKWHGGSQIAPAKKLDLNHHLIGEELLELAENEVPPEDVVFHRFYINNIGPIKHKARKKASVIDDDTGELLADDVDDATDESDDEMEELGDGLTEDGEYDNDNLDAKAFEEGNLLRYDSDVTNRINLTPVALMKATCFSKTVFGGQPTKPDYRDVPCAVFSIPPLSVVGLSGQQALEEAKSDVLIYTSTFNPMENSISKRQEKTIMKLVVDSETDRVLGASICGPEAPEIIQGIAVADTPAIHSSNMVTWKHLDKINGIAIPATARTNSTPSSKDVTKKSAAEGSRPHSKKVHYTVDVAVKSKLGDGLFTSSVTELPVPWDPGGYFASAWGQAEIRGGRNVTDCVMYWADN